MQCMLSRMLQRSLFRGSVPTWPTPEPTYVGQGFWAGTAEVEPNCFRCLRRKNPLHSQRARLLFTCCHPLCMCKLSAHLDFQVSSLGFTAFDLLMIGPSSLCFYTNSANFEETCDLCHGTTCHATYACQNVGLKPRAVKADWISEVNGSKRHSKLVRIGAARIAASGTSGRVAVDTESKRTRRSRLVATV